MLQAGCYWSAVRPKSELASEGQKWVAIDADIWKGNAHQQLTPKQKHSFWNAKTNFFVGAGVRIGSALSYVRANNHHAKCHGVTVPSGKLGSASQQVFNESPVHFPA